MPTEKFELFPFQKEAVKFMLAREGTLLADEPGCGKTPTAIGVINAIAETGRILIVCPATIRLIWKTELERWLVVARPIQIIQGPDEIFNAAPNAVVVVNYDKAYQYRTQLLVETWDLAVADECHYLRNPGAKRSRVVLAIKAKRRLALSGTPLESRPAELRPVLSWLDPRTWPLSGWHEFGMRYCHGFWDGFKFDFTGASHLEELNARLRESVMIRRLKAQVLSELPSKFRSIVELSPGADLRYLLDEELEQFSRWQENGQKSGFAQSVRDLKVASAGNARRQRTWPGYGNRWHWLKLRW